MPLRHIALKWCAFSTIAGPSGGARTGRALAAVAARPRCASVIVGSVGRGGGSDAPSTSSVTPQVRRGIPGLATDFGAESVGSGRYRPATNSRKGAGRWRAWPGGVPADAVGADTAGPRGGAGLLRPDAGGGVGGVRRDRAGPGRRSGAALRRDRVRPARPFARPGRAARPRHVGAPLVHALLRRRHPGRGAAGAARRRPVRVGLDRRRGALAARPVVRRRPGRRAPVRPAPRGGGGATARRPGRAG